jgi:hypothetical protein
MKSQHKINISEKKVLEQAHTIFKDAEFPSTIKSISMEMIENIFSGLNNKAVENKTELEEQKTNLEKRKNTLLDTYLDGDIEKSIYKAKLTDIENEI